MGRCLCGCTEFSDAVINPALRDTHRTLAAKLAHSEANVGYQTEVRQEYTGKTSVVHRGLQLFGGCYTAVKMFARLAKRQSQHGVELWLIGMTPRVLAIVQRSPLGQLLGRERMHFNLEIAVARYLDDAAVRDQP